MECGSQFSVALTKSGAVYTWYVQYDFELQMFFKAPSNVRIEMLILFYSILFYSILLCTSRGKGDYHRLGHGSDDHVRRPRQVQGLQGKKVIAIATGSLHCVCCTEDGKKDPCLFIPFRHVLSIFQTVQLVWSAAALKALLLCLAQEKCIHGVTTMRANLEMGPLTPSRGHGW